MRLEHKLINGTLTVILHGELDESCAAFVRAELDALISAGGIKRVVLDFGSLTFMDSTGIGFLIGRYKKASRLSVPIYIENPNFAADKILNLSGIY